MFPKYSLYVISGLYILFLFNFLWLRVTMIYQFIIRKNVTQVHRKRDIILNKINLILFHVKSRFRRSFSLWKNIISHPYTGDWAVDSPTQRGYSLAAITSPQRLFSGLLTSPNPTRYSNRFNLIIGITGIKLPMIFS